MQITFSTAETLLMEHIVLLFKNYPGAYQNALIIDAPGGEFHIYRDEFHAKLRQTFGVDKESNTSKYRNIRIFSLGQPLTGYQFDVAVVAIFDKLTTVDEDFYYTEQLRPRMLTPECPIYSFRLA